MRPVSWDEARPIVERLIEAVPDDLRTIPAAQRAQQWPAWVERRRAAIEARLARGEEDSLANLLLFGTSFTTEPRMTAAFLERLDREWQVGDRQKAERTLAEAYRQRAADLVTAMRAPGADEHLRFARTVVERTGHRLDTETGREQAQQFLLANVVRVRQESAAITRALEEARRMPDSTEAFAERSRVFRDRGLAPDSSVLTQYAVDRAVSTMKARGLVSAGQVARVAIVGPGLDFVDKQEGLDFYPPQSLQPFAVIDSLSRLGLAAPRTLTVVTLDVNPRVTRHLDEARQRAERDRASYRLVLPRFTEAGWLPDAVDYWRRLGSEVGTPVEVRAPASLPGIAARGIAVGPAVVDRVAAVAADIVYDRLVPSGEGRFDLVVATNVLLYYDTFEQTLAFANIAALLRPGGLLLTNNALLEVPEVPMVSGGYVTVRFSDREGDGEHMVWYRRR